VYKSEHKDKNEWAAATNIRSEYSCKSKNINEGWLSFYTQTINMDFSCAAIIHGKSPHDSAYCNYCNLFLDKVLSTTKYATVLHLSVCHISYLNIFRSLFLNILRPLFFKQMFSLNLNFFLSLNFCRLF